MDRLLSEETDSLCSNARARRPSYPGVVPYDESLRGLSLAARTAIRYHSLFRVAGAGLLHAPGQTPGPGFSEHRDVRSYSWANPLEPTEQFGIRHSSRRPRPR